MERKNARQLLMLEQLRRTINLETISSEIPMPSMDDITPILKMVAEVRTAYLKGLFDVANECEGIPTIEQIQKLQELRRSYSELVDATNALETALERGYINAA